MKEELITIISPRKNLVVLAITVSMMVFSPPNEYV
jgi:hypothetical protein